MARSTTRAKDIIKTRIAAFIIVMLVLLGTAYALMPANLFGSSAPRAQQYPPCPGAKDIAVTAKETVVELQSYCLTGRILLPVGHNFRVEAVDDGEIEFFFWNGQRFLVKEKETKWLGDVPQSIFRLRGKSGQATISLTKR